MFKKLISLTAVLLLICGMMTAHAETLSGTGDGLNGEIAVNVTVEDGVIKNVEILSHSETPGISDPAIEQLPEAIVAANSADVDVVTGATFTSKGIISAVKNALGEEKCKLVQQPYEGLREAFSSQETLDAYNSQLQAVDTAGTAYFVDKNTPRTLANGVKVQPVPNDEASFNMYSLNADGRGCFACHTQGFEEVLSHSPKSHVIMRGSYNQPWSLETCIVCHDTRDESNAFINIVHGIHTNSTAFNSMGGNCFSCHSVSNDGEYELWDRIKYSLFHGVTEIDAASIPADFRFDQDVVTPTDEMYFHLSEFEGNPTAWLPYSDTNHQIFDAWTITVSGEVDNPFTMTLPEMIAEFGTVTDIRTNACVAAGIGDVMTANCEVTGIPLSKILEKAQVKPNVNMMIPFGDDGYAYPMGYEDAMACEPLLVYLINGEMIPAEEGYPCQLWGTNYCAGNFAKRPVNIYLYEGDVATENFLMYGANDWGILYATGEYVYYNRPMIAFTNVQDGQIFEAGKPVGIEGYAFAWDQPVTKLEYSLDRGKTWKVYDLENIDSTKWVYWFYTLNLDPGAYVLQMRATDASGIVSAMPIQMVINVQ